MRGHPALRVLLLLLLPPQAASAAVPQFTVVQQFAEIPKNPVDRLLEVGDGVFYGASMHGGAFFKGSIFVLYRRPDTSWAEFTVHSFKGSDGANPGAGVILGSDGNFYGTTNKGGAFNGGTVFKMSPVGALVTLHSFAELSVNTRLVEADDGTLWGSADNPSRVYKITKTGAVTTVAFVEGGPHSLIQASDGNFYGTTVGGGLSGSGTAFRITPAGAYTKLHDFGATGVFPRSALTQGSDGRLYGTTKDTVFAMTLTGTVSVLHDGEIVGPGGGQDFANGVIEGPDHAFYGTTLVGDPESPSKYGTAFRVTVTGEFAVIAVFGGDLGAQPLGLTLGRDGRLYGITATAATLTPTNFPPGFGAAFSLSTVGGSTPAMVYPFVSDRPVTPMGRLLEIDGALFGTSCLGGLYGFGTVYKLTATGVSTLHSFNLEDGLCPVTGLTRGADSALYGTTLHGGDPGIFSPGGTVFRITTSGDFTRIHSFATGPDPAASQPLGELAAGSDGDLYGTTWMKGGTVFRVATPSSFTVVHDFGEVRGPAYPRAGLVLGSDGDFYGVTSVGYDAGSPSGYSPGWLFRMSPEGGVIPLHLFDAERAAPNSLMQSADGHLYGTATGGVRGAGLVFRATLSGSVSTVHDFAGTDGFDPYGQLTDAPDGAKYGTTYGRPGTSDFGTVFRLGLEGTLTTVHRFLWVDGANPYAGVIRAVDGTLFGTTVQGGLGGNGVIYRIVP